MFYYIYFSTFTIILFLLLVLMFQKQQKLKAIGAKKLGLLQLEISIETKKTKKSIKNAVKIATLEQKTSYKIKEIQLKILSIHFTIDELLKN